MKEKRRSQQYEDGLDKMEIKQIEQLPLPWQRNFLLRFYEQLKKQKLGKIDVIDKISKKGTERYKLLPDNYCIPANTLSQYTRFDSKNIRPVNVSNLIAISNALNVSIDYLLGIDSCENHQNADINKVTGLTNEAIETLKNNEEISKILNYFLSISQFDEIVNELEQNRIMYMLSHDILNAYSELLYNKIKVAHHKYFEEVFPLDRGIDKYKYYLCQEISFDYIKANSIQIKIFLKDNLSEDLYNNIWYDMDKNMDDMSIYHVFIDQTADFTYSFLEYKLQKEITKNRMFQLFMELFDSYAESQLKSHKRKVKR